MEKMKSELAENQKWESKEKVKLELADNQKWESIERVKSELADNQKWEIIERVKSELEDNKKWESKDVEEIGHRRIVKPEFVFEKPSSHSNISIPTKFPVDHCHKKPAAGGCKDIESDGAASVGKTSRSRRPRGSALGSKKKPKPPIIITRDSCNSMQYSGMLEVHDGCDIMEKLSNFAKARQRGLCVLSGTGAVSNVSLRQRGASVGSLVTLHGKYEILTLSGTVLPPPAPPGAGGLSIFLSGGQGQVVGGNIAGPLLAAGTVILMAALFSNVAYERLPLDGEEDTDLGAHDVHVQSASHGYQEGGYSYQVPENKCLELENSLEYLQHPPAYDDFDEQQDDHETVEDLGEIDCMQAREVADKDDNWDSGENVQAYIRRAATHHSSEEEHLINSLRLNNRMNRKWDSELTDPIRGSTGKLLRQHVEKPNDLLWDACPSRSLSLNFRAEILLMLNLTHYNDAQLWMGKQDLVSLKQVDLSYSRLITLPDLSNASKLRSLYLQGCINLVEVSSIQFLIKLEYLNLNGCTSLRSLPSMMALKLLSSLHLSGCSKIGRLPLSIGCLSSLIVLDIQNCKGLQNLPISTSRLKSIQNLNISGCSKLMKRISGSGIEGAPQSVMASSLSQSESIINPGSYISSNSSSDDMSVRPQNNEIVCPSYTSEEGKSFKVNVLEGPLSVTASSPVGRTEGIEENLLGESSESLNQVDAQYCQKRCLESFMGGSSNTANFEETPLVRRRISSESEPLSSSTTKEKESTELEGGIKPSSLFLEPSLARNETRLSKGLVQTSPSKNLQSEEQENSAKESVLPRPLGIKTSDECTAYINYGFSPQRKALESYMDMPVEAIHEADAYEDVGRILDGMIQQTSDLRERTNLEDIMSFLEELNENIPDTMTCLKSSRTHRILLQLKLTCLDVSLVEGQERYTSLEAKLATISEEEAKLEAEIQLLMAKKEELSKEHQTTPN